MKFYSKEGKELNFGDVLTVIEDYTTRLGKVHTQLVTTVTKENINHLIESGYVVAKEDNCDNCCFETVYKRLSEKTGMTELELDNLFDKVYDIYPMATMQILLRQIAEILDEKYEDHISESNEIYVVNTINGKIVKVNKENIKNYKNFSAFRSMEDAKTACKVLKKLFKEMYK